jgi:hypothetical protein
VRGEEAYIVRGRSVVPIPGPGKRPSDAVMTAVDESLNRVVRYKRAKGFAYEVRIVLNPMFTLTD